VPTVCEMIYRPLPMVDNYMLLMILCCSLWALARTLLFYYFQKWLCNGQSRGRLCVHWLRQETRTTPSLILKKSHSNEEDNYSQQNQYKHLKHNLKKPPQINSTD